ncbi:M20/M25/M40 family metallo-hydrolase [Sphingomonas sp.]|uniref:M20/M25/M40 family metallo-hydrolase n=1 Tax=Sphingomonas sp. TaxID=28214 RepID=UPI001D9CF21B|nr:M20/M25/M40 family metallo-hydrolase [Sphingomonas sp.]MBX9797319.1 M20/M25/M40 family metallo-hydrolase [Sphingomonas sp.]
MRTLILLAAALLPAAASAQTAPDATRLRADVAAMVGFGTRHTLSSATDPKRGIGAARNWAAARFEEIGRACGGCITVERIARSFTGPRAPGGVVVENVLGIQRGRDPGRVVIIGAHIDSRVSDALDAVKDAPGANDNASGVALVLEAARHLSREKFDATIIYAVFSGEEQGLWGGTLLAETARDRGWDVAAMLNNDIVGNTMGQNGVRVADRVRVFSEGIRASEDAKAQLARRGNGGEDDGPSRALAKLIDAVAATLPNGLDVFVDRRPDRFGRGGDHEPFLRLGYPAVRFSVGAENWTQQHQDLRREGGIDYGDTIDKMDFAYLARVTAINIAAARRIAAAPAAPKGVTINGALSFDTNVKWQPVPGAHGYRIRWRRTDTMDWTGARDVGEPGAVLQNVSIDDHLFAVSSLSAAGAESVPVLAGPEGRP